MKTKLAVIGATGLVGEEFIKILQEENKIQDFEILKFRRNRNPAESEWGLTEDLDKLKECRFIFNAASSDAAKTIAPLLGEGQYLIDNSSAYRMDPEVPLVVPEVNADLISTKQKIFANPNCTAGILCTALVPLKKHGIKKLIISTYQAASGAGKEALAELKEQLSVDKRAAVSTKIFGYRLGGNVLSHNSPIVEEGQVGAGFNEEEFKVMEEAKKILSLSNLPISVTCIRVPVERAHTETVVIDLESELSVADLRELYKNQPGLILVDEPKKNYFPMPLEADGKREVLVGRFRKDLTVPKRYLMMVSGDQLLKGAAWNAYQIFDILLKKLQ
jgi:aspartate-semialdehyde dehydrogenase